MPPTHQDEIDRSPPAAFFFSGQAFLKAAQHLHDAESRGSLRLRFDMPVYYLYSHAIELTMKAFLRANGITTKELLGKKFGHSLRRLWEECLDRGLVLDAAPLQLIAEIVHFLEPYATSYEFRYIQIGYKTLPSLPDVRSAAEKLSSAIRPRATVSA